MISDEQLHTLSDGTELETLRPLREIEDRGRHLRRQRTLQAGGGAALTLAVAAAIVVPLLPGRGTSAVGPADRPPITTGPIQHEDVCDASLLIGNSTDIRVSQVPHLLYLPSSNLIPGTMYQAGANQVTMDCTTVVAPVKWYSVQDGHISRVLSVTGPGLDVSTMFAGMEQFGVHPVTLTTGQGKYSYAPASQSLVIEWTDSQGQQWTGESEGLSQQQAIAAFNAITFRGGHVDPASAPPGLSTLAPTLGGGPVSTSAPQLDVQYWDDTQHGLAQLYVRQVGDQTLGYLTTGLRPVTINGQPGYLNEISKQIIWKLADGVYAEFYPEQPGRFTAQQVIDIARSTVTAPASDPRWVFGTTGVPNPAGSPASPTSIPSPAGSAGVSPPPSGSPGSGPSGSGQPTGQPIPHGSNPATPDAHSTATGWF